MLCSCNKQVFKITNHFGQKTCFFCPTMLQGLSYEFSYFSGFSGLGTLKKLTRFMMDLVDGLFQILQKIQLMTQKMKMFLF